MKIADLRGISLGHRAEVFKRYLDSLPNDEVISTVELEQAVGRTYRKHVQLLPGYSILICDDHGQRRLFGNPKAIAALKKHLSHENRTRD